MKELANLVVGLFIAYILMIIAVLVLHSAIYAKLGKRAGMRGWKWAWVPYFGPWFVGAWVGNTSTVLWVIPALGLLSGLLGMEYTTLIAAFVMVYLVNRDKRILERFGKSGKLAYLNLIPITGTLVVYILIASIAFSKKPYGARPVLRQINVFVTE